MHCNYCVLVILYVFFTVQIYILVGREGKEGREGRRGWVVCDEGDLLYMLVFYYMLMFIFLYLFNLFLLKPICIIIEYIFTASNKIIFKYNLSLPMQNMLFHRYIHTILTII